MRWRSLVLVGALVALPACTNQLGRQAPDCGLASNSIVVEIQAVPSAAYVPCIKRLEVGWAYNDVVPRSGLAEFSLDSDRIGKPFVKVRTTASCAIGDAVAVPSDERPIELYRDVQTEFTVSVVIVPEGTGDETLAAAQGIATRLAGERFSDRLVYAWVDGGPTPTSERVESARAAGAHVLIVGVRDAEEGTVTLVLAGRSEEHMDSVRNAFAAIEDTVAEPSYRGSWFYVFDGGCTELQFDAAGPGVETLATDVGRSLSFTDAEAIKQAARDAGYRIP